MTRRIQVCFDDRAMSVIERLRESTGESVAGVVRDALGFYEWARMQVAEGKSIAVVDPKKNRVREFYMPFKEER